jgi:hypothetical protein
LYPLKILKYVKENLKNMDVDFFTKVAKVLEELLVNLLNSYVPELSSLKRVLGIMKKWQKP